MHWYRSGCRDPVCTFESYDPITREVGHYDRNWTTISPKEDTPMTTNTTPIVTDIIDRLPDTACLITDMHPWSRDPENGAEPVRCGICDHVVIPDMMAVLVDDNHMPDSGGPTYAEACEDCIDWLCEKLADAGIGVDVED